MNSNLQGKTDLAIGALFWPCRAVPCRAVPCRAVALRYGVPVASVRVRVSKAYYVVLLEDARLLFGYSGLLPETALSEEGITFRAVR